MRLLFVAARVSLTAIRPRYAACTSRRSVPWRSSPCLTTFAIWTEPDSERFYRVLGALAVLDVFLVIVQPLLRRLVGPGGARTRVVLEGIPVRIDEALRRIEGSGVRVRR